VALSIYLYDENNSTFSPVSKQGLQTRPVVTTHDGTNGQTVETKLFVRNDDLNYYYTNITFQGTPARKVRVGDINYPEAFVGFKLLAQDSQPTESEWAAVESGNVLSFPDVGSTSEGDTSYKPLWLQITIPPGTRVQTITDIAIGRNAESNPVGT